MDTGADLEMLRYHFRELAEACSTLVKHLTLIDDYLNPPAHSRVDDPPVNIQGTQSGDQPDCLFDQLIMDAGAKTVTYRGRACRLGNTLAYRMLEKLARRPNQFLTFDRLIRDVWDGHPRSDEAIRSLAKELRDRLRRSGMRKLARAIHGQHRAYSLAL